MTRQRIHNSSLITVTVLLCSLLAMLSCARFPIDLSALLPNKKSDLCSIQHGTFYDFQASTMSGASPDQQAILSVDGAPQAFTMYIEPTTGAIIEEWDYFTSGKELIFSDGVYQGGVEVPLPQVEPYASAPQPAVYPWEISREFTPACVVAVAGPAFFDTSAVVLAGWNDGYEVGRLWTLAGGGSMITVDGHLALLSIDPGEARDLEQYKIRDFLIGTLGDGDARLGAILSPGNNKGSYRLSLSPRGQGTTMDGTEYEINLKGSRLTREFVFGEDASASVVNLEGFEKPVTASGTLTIEREGKIYNVEIDATVDGQEMRFTGLMGNGFWEDNDSQTALALGDRSPRVVVQSAAPTPLVVASTPLSPVPTQPAASLSTAVAPAQPEQESKWRLLLEDTFDNNDNGWPVTYSNEGDLVFYQSDLFEDQYLIFVEYRSGTRPFVKRTIDFNLGTSFLIEANIKQEGQPKTDCGIIISSADETVSLKFNLAAMDGELAITRKTSDSGWVELLPWTDSPDINNGDSNKMVIFSYSGGVMVFINDKLAAISEISALDVQQLGFTATVLPETSVTCTFDNLRVYTK